jgi:hypothetical protein
MGLVRYKSFEPGLYVDDACDLGWINPSVIINQINRPVGVTQKKKARRTLVRSISYPHPPRTYVIVGDSTRGLLKQRGKPHLKPATKPKYVKSNHAGTEPCRTRPAGTPTAHRGGPRKDPLEQAAPRSRGSTPFGRAPSRSWERTSLKRAPPRSRVRPALGRGPPRSRVPLTRAPDPYVGI